MAGSTSCFPCLLPTKKAVSPSFNIVHRLHMRQLRGSLRPTARTYPVCRSLFGKIPGRLGIPLKNIVDASSLLDEGHVFLGFSKDGQFVLSYTLNVDVEDHTSFPVYIYQLFWWRYRDNQPMYKVSEVRLFNEEEIQQDLYIAVCSWPTDGSKILVYGCCMSSKPRSEEKLMCYVTITAVPSLAPCPKCLHLKYSTDTDYTSHADPGVPPDLADELSATSGAAAPPCCLQHSFAVHTQYELSPPFPSFSPKHSLAKDGLVVLNTGDSIIALAVNVGDQDLPSGSLYSPLLTPSRGSSTHRSSLHGTGPLHVGTSVEPDDDFEDLEDSAAYPHQIERHSRALAAMDLDSYQLCDEWDYPESSPAMFLHDSDFDGENTRDTDDDEDEPTLRDHTLSPMCNTGHWSDADSSCLTTSPGHQQPSQQPPLAKSSPPWSASEDVGVSSSDPTFSAALPEIQVSAHSPSTAGGRITGATVPTETHSPGNASENAAFGSESSDERNSRRHSKSKNHFRGAGPRNQVDNSPVAASQEQTHTGGNIAQKTNPAGGDKSAQTNNCLAGPYMSWSSPLRCGGYTVSDRGSTCGEDGQLGSEIEQHCPYHHRATEGSTQGSQRTMQECTCKLQGFTYSVRRYVERTLYHDYLQPLEPDTFDYHSTVPLVVCGTQKSPMVMTSRCLINEGYHVEVKQLTMDAEHYLCVTIRTYAPWAKRYISFTDYDMQILDVCGDSYSVVVMVIALIRAWPEPTVPRDVFEFDDDPTNETPKLYETSFKFSWNLKTGQYQTIEVGELKEFNQATLCKTWNPGRVLCQRLQREWAVPQGHARSVHVLTNEAVFKNKSLRKLLDPVHYVAIVLT
ncbi:DDB1- and CUL4-associated factor 15-like [Patiria miniata]|uniref:DDB1- and CUL4-associated factor 15 WD40 repeat-containing domain-containing protein n=1 Tax=Patiria miniata TaxID=46514 RepID=A0A914AYT8_PATMI|nr:DDB1- and CUL4-associated factor 15-like [Patiria miniata]